MKFTYPEFLWAFLFLSIPIIIHLFNFRRYKTLFFSSLQFIKRIEQETRSTKKWKHLLVLLSRILALGFLILAFSRPFQPVEKEKNKGGAPVLSIYLDNSFSMTAKGTEGELISEARETARKLIEKSGLQTLFLLHTNTMNGVEQRLVSRIEALERLDQIEPVPLVRKLGDIISWQRSVLQKEGMSNRTISSVQHVFLSDFQKRNLDDFHVEKDLNHTYYPILFRPQLDQNLSVDSVWFSSPMRKINENNELHIRLRNFGEQTVTNAELHIEIGKIQRDVFCDLKPNDTHEVKVNYSDKTPGIKMGKILVRDKQLFWDDDFYFSYVLNDHTSVLVINGENIHAPVARVFALESYFKQKVVNENEFSGDQLNAADLVVLNGLNSVSSGMKDQLVQFGLSGGALAIFPGPSPDFNSFGELLSDLSLPALSVVSSKGSNIRKLVYEDPFFTGMFEKKKEDLRMPNVKKYFNVSVSSKTDFFPLITLDNGSPLFLRSGGITNAFLFCGSLENDFGNFTNNALFPSLLLRIGEMSQRKAPIALTLGRDAYYPLYQRVEGESPVHIRNQERDFIPEVEKRGAISYLSLNGQEALEYLHAGNYAIQGDTIQAPISLNYDRSESMTDYMEKEDLLSFLENKGLAKVFAYEVSNGQSNANITIDKPFEYWKWFVALSLLFLLLELLLLKFWR